MPSEGRDVEEPERRHLGQPVRRLVEWRLSRRVLSLNGVSDVSLLFSPKFAASMDSAPQILRFRYIEALGTVDLMACGYGLGRASLEFGIMIQYDPKALAERAVQWRAVVDTTTSKAMREFCPKEALWCERRVRMGLDAPALLEPAASNHPG